MNMGSSDLKKVSTALLDGSGGSNYKMAQEYCYLNRKTTQCPVTWMI